MAFIRSKQAGNLLKSKGKFKWKMFVLIGLILAAVGVVYVFSSFADIGTVTYYYNSNFKYDAGIYAGGGVGGYWVLYPNVNPVYASWYPGHSITVKSPSGQNVKVCFTAHGEAGIAGYTAEVVDVHSGRYFFANTAMNAGANDSKQCLTGNIPYGTWDSVQYLIWHVTNRPLWVHHVSVTYY